MKKNHWAVFLSNDADTQSLVQQIINGKAVEPFTAFNSLKGVLFSPILLNELIEEESRRDYSDVTKNINRELKSLSSGEQKKALLAYVLAQQPDYIILDNPFDNLDKVSQQSLQIMLAEVATHTTFIQLINRKADLLPFIHQAISVEKNNAIVILKDAAYYFHQQTKNQTTVIADAIPQAIHHYHLQSKTLVQFNDVTVSYDDKTIVKNICWTIDAGSFWQLVGPNGSGKTTLLTMITGDNVKGYGKDLQLFGKRKGSGETVWEIKQRNIIDMAADRGAYICQSQSLNLFIDNATTSKLTSMHFYGWKKGLKTGMYYLRTQAATQAVQFTVEKQGSKQMEPVIPNIEQQNNHASTDVEPTEVDGPVCTMQDGCISCGS